MDCHQFKYTLTSKTNTALERPCEPPEWTLEFDMTTGLHGWSILDERGLFQEGTGLLSAPGYVENQNIWLERPGANFYWIETELVFTQLIIGIAKRAGWKRERSQVQEDGWLPIIEYGLLGGILRSEKYIKIESDDTFGFYIDTWEKDTPSILTTIKISGVGRKPG